MLMLYMFLTAPPVSAVLTLLVRKKIDISVRIPRVEVEKDGVVQVEVYMRNRAYIPVPFVDITFAAPSNLTLSEGPGIGVALAPRGNRTITISYTARCRGVVSIGVERVKLRGYMGILRLSILKSGDNCENLKLLTVAPRIYYIKADSRILLSTAANPGSEENREDTLSTVNLSGEPGYEYREYAAGDPLNKIHWKLSAKRDIFMIRKDQGAALRKKYLVLDPLAKSAENAKKEKAGLISRIFFDLNNEGEASEGKEADLVQEKLLEAMLSIANTVLNTGRSTEVCFFQQGEWHEKEVRSISELVELQHQLASYEFIDASVGNSLERIPMGNLLKNWGRDSGINAGEVIIFTASLDEILNEYINKCSKYGIGTNIVFAAGDFAHEERGSEICSPGNLWTVKPGMDITDAFGRGC
ncbi:MAG: DUF58 domain-containing protein [Bacillota bacterium]|nr:DUF58 domain-containing protein [Bacillota bacterium]